MARKEKKYHYFYKTINVITGRYYYGIHSTNNLNDGYIGSGKRLWYSINKYGKENHVCEILEFFETRKKLLNKEKEIVNEEMVKNPMCMNISLGGLDGVNISGLNIYGKNGENGKKNLLCGNNLKEKLKSKGKWNEYKNNLSKSMKKRYETKPHHWLNKKHSSKTKEIMSQKKRGVGIGIKNSQFGTCWITNGINNKKIKKNDKIPDGWKLGRIMEV